ncbi:MAG: caspase family protein [Desulfobacteraceae bacterium]|nr:caspase family protein [Desulfobacteraceae bacterium]
MRIANILKSIVVIVCLFAFVDTCMAARVALVIGNGVYKAFPLKNPVNDARLMTRVLRECGFAVSMKTNVNRKQMRHAIRAFGEQLKKDDIGFFYYAGHGVQVEGENYLVPVGSDVFNEAEVPDECLLVSSVLRQMEQAGNDLNIIILDASRSNPFADNFKTTKAGLARMDAPTGSFLAYSTAPGSVTADGKKRNGLYTQILTKNIWKKGLKIEEVFKQTRIEVLKSSQSLNHKQVPWESSSLIGDFYFFSKNKGAGGKNAADPESITALTADNTYAYWQNCIDLNLNYKPRAKALQDKLPSGFQEDKRSIRATGHAFEKVCDLISEYIIERENLPYKNVDVDLLLFQKTSANELNRLRENYAMLADLNFKIASRLYKGYSMKKAMLPLKKEVYDIDRKLNSNRASFDAHHKVEFKKLHAKLVKEYNREFPVKNFDISFW